MVSVGENNPLREGLDQERAAEASVLVIFGASGDLTKRKLLPALYSLAHDGLLPAGQTVVGVARREYSEEEFRAEMRRACEEHARRPLEDAIWETFAAGLFYMAGEAGEDETFTRLEEKLAGIDRERGTGGRRVYYFAVPPQLFPLITSRLGAHGMVSDPDGDQAWTRVVIEKPFGHDLASARELNATAVAIFREPQVFRIDHYLGKETVQNILVLRFANGIFEPFWNRHFVDHVQITVAESIGIEGRGSYFDGAGIVRDIVQNHMLQLLALVAMEPPARFAADQVRDEKEKVFAALRPFPEEPGKVAVAGQYMAGSVLGAPVPGYREEPKVARDSRTETYAAIHARIDNWRWAGVPFYLRAGKRLPKRATAVSIHFRPAPYPLFRGTGAEQTRPNVLTIRIQPDEGIALRFDSKVPGPTIRTHPVSMEFRYATSFGAEPPDAYERLLLDVMIGDATLFARRDEVEAAWRWLDPLLERWAAEGHEPDPYEAGTWGPPAADEMLARKRRSWRRP
ncbi:MAG TPA: glucose-6-phosphate dehydrogenase [Thermoanaerobaculia bacterium]|nr:glucose-6-phosphate dehydrogenase [Thermoanaerobaculia bacterium]